MSNLYRWHSTDASYQVSVHLAKISENKIKMWKVNGRRTPSDGKSSHCLWQGELKKSNINLHIGQLLYHTAQFLHLMHFYIIFLTHTCTFKPG